MIKVLYAEDDMLSAKLCVSFMTDKGYKVFHALDGERALQIYKKEKPDIILLDVVMPNKTGLEVAKTIREEDLDTPIFFISSLTTTQNVVEGLDVGANDYIRKEVLLEEVEARIQSALRYASRHAPKVNLFRIAEDISLDMLRRDLTIRGQVIHLTPLESRIMRAFCLNKNHYIPKEELIRVGWDRTFDGASRYLDKVIVQLRKHFPKGGDPLGIETSWGKAFGLMQRKEDEKDDR